MKLIQLSLLQLLFTTIKAFHLLPGHFSRSKRSDSACSLLAAITSGDTVLVVGGTGGIGQLVTKKLQNRGDITVKATSRDIDRARETMPNTNLVQLDLVNTSIDSLQHAIDGVQGIVITVGTTAFPTKKWAGGNSPQAIDRDAVQKIAQAAAQANGIKKVVLVTSVGVNRTKQMPFLILNLFGVLDAKRAGEEALKEASSGSFDLVIVRPGRLIGGPFTNADLAQLFRIEGGAENGVDVASGDSLLGDCKRDACAEAIVQCLLNDVCKNIEFSIISNDSKALNDAEWTTAFTKLATSS